MLFSSLLDGVESLAATGDAEVSGLQYDSRQVRPGECFVAMRGETTDGNRFIAQALQKGAAAVVTDSASVELPPEFPIARVAHGRRALARLAANFFAHPERQLRFTGITGTNGKTTVSFLLEAMLSAAERKPALLGTIEYRIAGKAAPALHTTPEPLDLYRIFGEALAAGATDVVMEVSSHALAQQRVAGIPFEVAVFTNLTRDHLDYHRDMDDYFAAKQLLFTGLDAMPPLAAVINQDDAYGQKLIHTLRSRPQVIRYGLEQGDFHAKAVELTLNGTCFDMTTPSGTVGIFSPLVGKINVYNILAAAAAAHALGVTAEKIAEALLKMKQVPGRFQRVSGRQPFAVVVDYAHTDDALRNLTSIARDFVTAGKAVTGHVITVFGCGGDRDRAKRPLMGRAAAEGSDCVIVTSDNPRSEEPLSIIHDVLPGLRGAGAEYTIEPDRRRAISLAIQIARPGDIVLIAGKGHEKYQVTREGAQPFDDMAVAGAALRAAGFCEEFDDAVGSALQQRLA